MSKVLTSDAVFFRLYADAIEQGKNTSEMFQVKTDNNEWVDFDWRIKLGHNYRLKPRKLISGEECPVPHITPPKLGECFYIPDITTKHMFREVKYSASERDKLLISRGLAFVDQKDAADMAKQILKLLGWNHD